MGRSSSCCYGVRAATCDSCPSSCGCSLIAPAGEDESFKAAVELLLISCARSLVVRAASHESLMLGASRPPPKPLPDTWTPTQGFNGLWLLPPSLLSSSCRLSSPLKRPFARAPARIGSCHLFPRPNCPADLPACVCRDVWRPRPQERATLAQGDPEG